MGVRDTGDRRARSRVAGRFDSAEIGGCIWMDVVASRRRSRVGRDASCRTTTRLRELSTSKSDARARTTSVLSAVYARDAILHRDKRASERTRIPGERGGGGGRGKVWTYLRTNVKTPRARARALSAKRFRAAETLACRGKVISLFSHSVESLPISATDYVPAKEEKGARADGSIETHRSRDTFLGSRKM